MSWVPIDKDIIYHLPKDRPYSIIEAFISYRVDLDNGVNYSLNGYAKLWGWSRCRVRDFINKKIRHFTDTLPTLSRHPISLVVLGSQPPTDSLSTVYRQFVDTTIKTRLKQDEHIGAETAFPVSARAEGSKVVKTKNGAFKPPPVSDVCAYAKEQGLTLDAQYYFDSRESTGWVKINGAEVKNWKNDMNNADKNGWPKANSERKLVQ